MAHDDYDVTSTTYYPNGRVFKEKQLRQPGDLKLGIAKQSAFTYEKGQRWFVIPHSTSDSSKEARRLAKWLLRTADWIDDKKKRGFK
jgi:hypothetical protein